MKASASFAIGICLLSAAESELLPPEVLEPCRQVIKEIYDLEYGRAKAVSQQLIAAAADDPAGYVMLARAFWAEQLSGERALSIDRFASSDFFARTTNYQDRLAAESETRFRDLSAEAISRGRAKLAKRPNDPAALYLLGLAYQNLGSFDYSIKGNWWSSFRNGEQTVRYHRELLRVEPGLVDPHLTTGVANYVAAVIPWRVKWLSFLLGYRGSKERGKQELESVAERGQLVADDARTILVLLYARDGQYDKALAKLTELLRKYPQNYLVHLEMGGVALKTRRYDDAISIYRDILSKTETGRDKYDRMEKATVLIRLGVVFRDKGELPVSVDWLRRALAEPKRSPRMTTVAQLELGKTLDLMGLRDEALDNYRAVQAAEDVAGSKREAQTLIARRFHP